MTSSASHSKSSASPPTRESSPRDGAEWIVNRRSSGLFPSLDIKEAWRYRGLSRQLALRDLRLRYKQTALGVAWAILQPIAGAAIFSVIFGHLARVPSNGIPYLVFAYIGLTAWLYVSGSAEAAAHCLVDQRNLVTKVYFPRIIAPFAAVLPGLLDFAASSVILVFLVSIYDVTPSIALLFLPLWLLAAVTAAFGIGLWLAALNVLYRDVRYALGFVLQVWLFASPVVFPSTLVHGASRYLFSLNPVVGLIDSLRWFVASGPVPQPADLMSALSTIVILAGGLIYFRRVERIMDDRI